MLFWKHRGPRDPSFVNSFKSLLVIVFRGNLQNFTCGSMHCSITLYDSILPLSLNIVRHCSQSRNGFDISFYLDRAYQGAICCFSSNDKRARILFSITKRKEKKKKLKDRIWRSICWGKWGCQTVIFIILATHSAEVTKKHYFYNLYKRHKC